MSKQAVSSDLSAAKCLIKSYSSAREQLEQEALVVAEKVIEIEAKLDKCESEPMLNQLYARSNEEREKLLSKLIVFSVIKKLIERNENRLTQLSKSEDIDASKIEPMTKKELKAYVGDVTRDVTAEALGLAENTSHIENYFGHKLLVERGKISAKNKSNLNEIKQVSAETLEQLLQLHPEIVSTFSGEALADRTLRTTLLKKVANFTFEQLKTKSVEQVNAMLGEPLYLKYELPASFREYIAGLKNLFKVKVKRYLASQYPKASSEIDGIKCNMRSNLLPSDFRELDSSQAKTESESDRLDRDIDEFLEDLRGGS